MRPTIGTARPSRSAPRRLTSRASVSMRSASPTRQTTWTTEFRSETSRPPAAMLPAVFHGTSMDRAEYDDRPPGFAAACAAADRRTKSEGTSRRLSSLGDDPLLATALALARRNIAVFPCRVGGKEPVTPHGCKDASTDLDTIRR